jgi:threonine aldolase
MTVGGTTPMDLRSDTVTRPTAEMRAAMASADVGDDVFRDDPTVIELERTIARRLGMEAAVFMPTGTQSNLCALLTHCGRGDEYIVGQMAHTYRWEGGGAAVLGGIQPQPLQQSADGGLDWSDIELAIKPLDDHFARTRLVCLENTWLGRVADRDRTQEVIFGARRRGLALHLDGARLFNAAVASGCSVESLAQGFDSVSVCFSKGLGAPAGSALCGSGEFVQQARRWRKMTGGGLRQSGILAAAALYALDLHVDRLAIDHANAAALADGLEHLPGVRVVRTPTNMVFLHLVSADADSPSARPLSASAHASAAALASQHGLRCLASAPLRLVTHLDFSAEAVPRAIEILRSALGPHAAWRQSIGLSA